MLEAQKRRYQVRVRHGESLLAHGIVAVLAREPDIDVGLGGEEVPCNEDEVLIADYAVAMEVLRAAKEGGSQHFPRVVVLGSVRRESDVRRALEIGVLGFLVVGGAIDDLAVAVRTVGGGSRYYDSVVADRIAESLSREQLTDRESDVLQLLAYGHCNKAIARELTIAVGTVKAHMKSIFAKLEASSRTHATTIALRRGLIDIPDRRH